MEPIKIQGKIREQMNREIKARREYNKKWAFMSKPELNQFYNEAHLNGKLREMGIGNKEKHTEKSGESYFASKAMFQSLNLCRCGREKNGTHLTKCMQKSLIKYSEQKSTIENESEQVTTNIPKTSNLLCGFFQCKYNNLEKSTRYISPKVHLKHKITDNIYNSIIIG